MQTWAKRGIQTALVTGGLLMLGTGIASADENVDPDRPAGPLDGSLSIPVHAANNAVGTPAGQHELPEVDEQVAVSADDVTGTLPAPARHAADQVTGAANEAGGQGAQAVGEAAEQLRPATGPAAEAISETGNQVSEVSPHTGQAMRDTDEKLAEQRVPGTAAGSNQAAADLAVPVEISGNALALGGPAEVSNQAAQSTSTGGSTTTNGADSALGGNVLDLDGAVPVQLTGNAVGLLGDATAESTVQQNAETGGAVNTDGTGGVLAGNALAGHFAAPVQITGNAVSGAGDAETESDVSSEASAGGPIRTGADRGVLSGTVGAVPAALPVELNGNALNALGAAEADSTSTAEATAGGTTPGLNDVPSYIQTTADGGVLSGTVAQGPLAAPAVISGAAGSVLGAAEAEGSTGNTAQAGGFDSSSAVGGVGSGTVANAPVALPVEAITHAVTAGGEAEALHDNTVDATAGDGSFTNGNESVLSGTSLATPVAGPADLLGNAVGVLGSADTAGDTGTGMHNEASAVAGGYNGTLGNDAIGAGNAATIPVALPVEGFADAVGALGTAKAAATEHKVSESGGDTSTVDDNSVLSANAVQTPLAGPVQAFGDALGIVAKSSAHGEAQNEVTAGGDSHANGVGGAGSGNIAQAPLQLPVQLFGLGGSVAGQVSGSGVNDTVGTSGGSADTDGTQGTLSGNVFSAPVGALAQVFGDSVTALGIANAGGDNLGDHVTGGDVTTAGDGGSLSGNAVTAQALPGVQLFGDAVDVAGLGTAQGDNDVVNTVGGDVSSSGDVSSLSGNLFDVPAAAVIDGFGDAVSVLGHAAGAGHNTAVHEVGGEATSAGGFAGQLPVGAVVQAYDIPVAILADAMTVASNDTTTTVGNRAPQLNMVFDGAELPVDELPSMPVDLPTAEFAGELNDGMVGPYLPGVVEQPVVQPRSDGQVTLPASAGDPAMSSIEGGGPLGLNYLMGRLTGKPYHIQGA